MSNSQTTSKRHNRNKTIPDLYDRMIANGSKIAQTNTDQDDGPTVPLSVRVPPHVKAYYEAQAKACGAASASAMIAMVLHGVMISTEGEFNQGLTFEQIGNLGYNLFSQFPIEIPALSEVESAALVGDLKSRWLAEWNMEIYRGKKE